MSLKPGGGGAGGIVVAASITDASSTGRSVLTGNAAAGLAALGTDASSATRPPSAHKSTHAAGGSDALAPSDLGLSPLLSLISTNLIADLDADAGVTLVSSAVSAWASQVGTMVASQSTSSKRPTVVQWHNGRSALRFDGVDDTLQIPWESALDLATLSVYAVLRLVRSSSDALSVNVNLFGRSLAATHVDPYYEWNAYYSGTIDLRTDGSVVATGTLPTGFTIDQPAIVSLSCGAAGGSLHLNGRRLCTTANTSITYSAQRPVAISGQSTTAGGEYARADYARFVIYSGQHTAAERAAVTRYLAQRYGVPIIDGLTI